MNKIERLIIYALFFMAMSWTPFSTMAQSPFNGTWRTDMDQSKISYGIVVFSVNKGLFDCPSCGPQIDVKADGRDHAVVGHPYDTFNVREVDPKSIAITTKKSGRTIDDETRAVSDNGNTLTVRLNRHPKNSDQIVSTEATLTRVGKGPAGAHATSGSWRIDKRKVSENSLRTTYERRGDELRMSTPIGESYIAKLDGKDYPVKGADSYNFVSLRRIDDRTIEQTNKSNGKVVEVVKMTVARGGRKITVARTNKVNGRTSTDVAEKQ